MGIDILSNKLVSTCWLWVELNNLCKAIHKSSSSMQGWPLKWIALIARSFLFLTQFINFQDPHFLLVISLIFPSKNSHLALLTVFLNFFQSSICWDFLYASRSVWHLWSHQALDCLVILTTLEYLCQILLILYVIFCIIAFKLFTYKKGAVLIFMIEWVSSLIKSDFSLLSLIRDYFLVWTCSSVMNMSIVIGVWLDESLQLEWM